MTARQGNSNGATAAWRRGEDGVLLLVRARPGAKRPGIAGVQETAQGPALAVRITEAPEKGRANKAIIALLAKALKVAKSDIDLRGGERQRLKRFVVRGDAARIVERLQRLASGEAS